MKIKGDLIKLYKGIYLLQIENSYDLAMTFCRVQEYYESPFKEIRGKIFTMSKLMRMYSMKFGDGVFTYPTDWSGFNIPSKCLDDLYEGTILKDMNSYDEYLKNIHEKIAEDETNYYLIGSRPNEKSTIQHEVAHGFYYLHKNYRTKTNKIVNSIQPSSLRKIKKYLLSIGYNNRVFRDEVQAYISHKHDCEYLIENANLNKRETKDLQNKSKEINIIFNEYNKNKI